MNHFSLRTIVTAGAWHNGSNGRWYTEMQVDRARGRIAFVGSNDGDRAKAQPAVAAVLKGAMEAGA